MIRVAIPYQGVMHLLPKSIRVATRTLLLLIAAPLCPGMTPLPAPEPDRTVVYKEPAGGKALSLHIYQPKGWNAADRRPVAIFFFGGGWTCGSAKQFLPQASRLASLGMVGISADYRTKGSHGTRPDACVEDGKSAVRWVRQHAAELGIDPQRIAVGGGSAGGHVAAASALCSGFDAPGEDLSISAQANALVLFNPVLDNGPDGGWGYKAVRDMWQKISPAHNIHAPVPPILFMLGTADTLIPVSTAQRFADNVKAAGGRCDLKIYPEAKHGFFNAEPWFSQSLADSIDFLKSLGWIDAK